jgi:hypothetical protein
MRPLSLAVALSGSNRNDVTRLILLLEDLHARVAGKVDRPRQKPDVLLADRGYDHDKHRRPAARPCHQAPHRPARGRAPLRLGP